MDGSDGWLDRIIARTTFLLFLPLGKVTYPEREGRLLG
jgi:hypothetical protein